MAFTNPFSTKTANVSTIRASEVNAAGVCIERSIDGVGGGTYTPTSPIDIAGANGVRIANTGFLTVMSGGVVSVSSGGALTANSGSTVTLAGATTASDFTMTGTNRVKVASRSITRVQSSIPLPTSATWTFTSGGAVQQSANNTDQLLWALRVPHGATLTDVQVGISPVGGHGGAPTAPALAVVHESSAGGTNIGSISDPTAFGSYEAFHEFGLTGLSHTVDRSARRYFALITGETGGNYVLGLIVHYVKCTYTITEYDED